MRLILAREYRRMRWKNGLGETAEIAISPQGAALDAFDWRISLACLETSGPFSLFPGIDRTLTVVAGAGFRLAVDEHPPAELTLRSEPITFGGESAVAATLLAGPVTDLNVMTRRDRLWHRVRRASGAPERGFYTTGDTTAVFCASGAVRVVTPGREAMLGTFDSALIEAAGVPLTIAAAGACELVFIEIGRPGAPGG